MTAAPPDASIADLLRQGVADHQAGRFADAARAYDAALAHTPEHAQALMLRGTLALQTGDAERAERWLAAAIAADPEQADAHNNLGCLLRASGRAAEAEEAFRRAAAADPANPDPWLNLAALARARGDGAAATGAWRGVLASQAAGNPGLLIMAGEGLLELGAYADAAQAFRRALAALPQSAGLHNDLGLTLERQGQLAEAEECFRRARALEPTSPKAARNLGALLNRAGRHAEAVDALTEAIALDPGAAAAHNNLGAALVRLGDADRAETAFRAALAIAPDLAEARRNLGFVLLADRRDAEALEAFRSVLAPHPDDSAAREGEADALRRLGRLAEAAIAYERALKTAGERPSLLHNQGDVLARLGRHAEAATCFERLLALDPANAVARHSLAALRGEAPESAPRDFVVGLFDAYAPRFERELVETLGYRIPERLRAMVDRLRAAGTLPASATALLDLGCGTGLAGRAFAGAAVAIDGIELAPKMAELARASGRYRTVAVGDLVEAMAALPGPYGLAVAADVFPYLGRLDGAFAAVRARLETGGGFAFSVERGSDDVAYALTPSGRFAHGRAALEALAARTGFETAAFEAAVIRTENGGPVEGWVAVLVAR